MKPVLSRENREFDQAQRALAAKRIIDDELIQRWFETEETRLTREMLATELHEDEKRRACLLEIRTLRKLWNDISGVASFGKKALEAVETRNGR